MSASSSRWKELKRLGRNESELARRVQGTATKVAIATRLCADDMMRYTDSYDKIVKWARDAFEEEIRTDFARVQTFDSVNSRIGVSAIRNQSQEQLQILAQVLPLGVGFQGPFSREARARLSDRERSAVEAFISAESRLQRAMWSEVMSHVARTTTQDARLAFRKIRKEYDGLVGEIGDSWECAILRAGAGEWCLVGKRGWGEVRVGLNFGRDFLLRYEIIFEGGGIGRTTVDSYLAMLGIGPSEWVVQSSSDCVHRLRKSSEFILWHAQQCEQALGILSGKQSP